MMNTTIVGTIGIFSDDDTKYDSDDFGEDDR